MKLADSVFIPAFRVDKVVHAPWGAYPSAVYHVYDYDAKDIEYYAEQNKDEAKFKKYVDDYILGVKDYWEYLEKWGGLRRLQALKAVPTWGIHGGDEMDFTQREVMAAAAAMELADGEVVVSGLGSAPGFHHTGQVDTRSADHTGDRDRGDRCQTDPSIRGDCGPPVVAGGQFLREFHRSPRVDSSSGARGCGISRPVSRWTSLETSTPR